MAPDIPEQLKSAPGAFLWAFGRGIHPQANVIRVSFPRQIASALPIRNTEFRHPVDYALCLLVVLIDAVISYPG